MKKALIIIDLQKGFIDKRTKHLPARTKNFIQRNKNKFDLILFTQFKNKPDSYFVKNLNYHSFMKRAEYDLVDEIKKFINQNNLFVKNTYSSFVDNKIFNILKENKITDIYLGGIQTENCVLTFARDAFDRGFKIIVLKNLCANNSGNKLHNAALEIIAENIGEVN